MAMLFKKKRDQDLDTIDIEPGAVTIMIENVNKIDTQTLILSEDGTMINEEDLEKFESLDSLDYHETDENDKILKGFLPPSPAQRDLCQSDTARSSKERCPPPDA